MLQSVENSYGIALMWGEDLFSKEKWDGFKKNVNDFGILKWNVEDPSLSVIILHLTLPIKDGNIVSKTYQKPLNLYQYICPISAHPLWMLEGIIFSTLKRYYPKISHVNPFWSVAMILYKRLKDWGWNGKTLEPICFI